MSDPARWPDWRDADWIVRDLPVGGPYSLASTCGPVAWSAGRWPNMDWIDGCLILAVREHHRTVVCVVRQMSEALLHVASPTDTTPDLAHLRRMLGADTSEPAWRDPVIAGLAARLPGLRPFSSDDLFTGLVTSIVGQSISVASAATTQRRLAAMFAEPVTVAGRPFWPVPDADQLATASAERVRESGVTWRRAEALVTIARLAVAGNLPDHGPTWTTMTSADRIAALRGLPLVGPWTARSTLLWGLADHGIWPDGDVALLRAARQAYARPDLTMRELGELAADWQPSPGWATHLLWAGLFGAAPATIAPG